MTCVRCADDDDDGEKEGGEEANVVLAPSFPPSLPPSPGPCFMLPVAGRRRAALASLLPTMISSVHAIVFDPLSLLLL